MAEDNKEEAAKSGGGGGDCPKTKCPDCPPPGLPGWMGTFSDLVTLLLTFFVLLLSFAKTETAKYEAALGSINNAFGGNVLKHGEVIQRGKSADNSPTMMEAQDVVRPFPIEFLTMEGLLDNHEINRYSEEELQTMRDILQEYELTEEVEIEEMNESIKVMVKEKIYFKPGTIEIENINIEVFDKLTNLLKNENWVVFIEGYAMAGEEGSQEPFMGKKAYELSSLRSMAVASNLMKKGVRSQQITSTYYGDSRPIEDENVPLKNNARVEFIIKKLDLHARGKHVRTEK
jgi:chemotaxis protein MotB